MYSALKTICALLNSNGGTLLLGVHDNLPIVGIEPDSALLGRKQDAHGFEDRLTDLIKTRIEPMPVGNFDVKFVPIDGATVCRIDVRPSKAVVYLDNRLYVRFGNSTEELTARKLQDWLGSRGTAAPEREPRG